MVFMVIINSIQFIMVNFLDTFLGHIVGTLCGKDCTNRKWHMVLTQCTGGLKLCSNDDKIGK